MSKNIMNLFLKKLNFIFIILLTVSCSTDEEKEIIEEIIVDPCENFSEELSDSELDYITKILIVDEEINNLWNDFNTLREDPIFILTEIDQGIYINPTASQLEASIPICNEIGGFENLLIYRNEAILEFSKPKVEGEAHYAFAVFEETPLYIYDITEEPPLDFYSEYKNRNGHYHVSVFYHELFHAYESKNHELYFAENFTQSFFQFPITDSTLPLLLLLFDVMIDAYHLENNNQRIKYLEYYVSIQNKLNEIDPSGNNLIRNHGFYLEKLEGTPRYIEVFSTLNSINNNTIDDPTHGYENYNLTISSNIEVRQVYARRIFYHTGAGVINLMEKLNYPNIDESFLSPDDMVFEIAETYLNMSNSEKENTLEEVKLLYDWDSLVLRSDFLLSL